MLPALQRVLFSMKLLKTDSNPDPGSLAQLNLDPDLNNKFQVFAAFRLYHFFALRNHIVYIQYTFAMWVLQLHLSIFGITCTCWFIVQKYRANPVQIYWQNVWPPLLSAPPPHLTPPLPPFFSDTVGGGGYHALIQGIEVTIQRSLPFFALHLHC